MQLEFHSLTAEILVSICSSLLHDEDKEGLRALVSLARTCRRLQGHSLDLLWHSLPTLAPLILTMPRDLWKLETSTDGFYTNLIVVRTFLKGFVLTMT